jgi:hypothetical protein
MTMISMHVGSADSDSIDADDNFVVAKWGLWLITPFEYIGLGINERLHEPLIARPVRLISLCRPHEADARICDSLIHICNLEIDRRFEFLLSMAGKIDGPFLPLTMVVDIGRGCRKISCVRVISQFWIENCAVR